MSSCRLRSRNSPLLCRLDCGPRGVYVRGMAETKRNSTDSCSGLFAAMDSLRDQEIVSREMQRFDVAEIPHPLASLFRWAIEDLAIRNGAQM